MRKELEKLFSRLEPPEPPAGLFGRVMSRIGEERRLSAARRRFAVFSFVFLAAGAALVPAFRMLQTGLSESGFTEFFSLVFSDSGAVFAYWRSFVFALLESLPAMSAAAFLGALFVFLQSLKFLARDTKVVFPALNNH
jgi:hypothetical protein